MWNMRTNNIQHKIDKMQRLHAHQHAYPESESDSDQDIPDQADSPDDASDLSSD